MLINGDLIYLKPEKPKFAIGDKVRISKYKRQVFDQGYTPKASKKKMRQKFMLINGDLIYLKPEKPKFAIGDKVRISKYKRQVFDQGYTP